MTIGIITGKDADGGEAMLAWYGCYNRARQMVLQRPDIVRKDGEWVEVTVREFLEGFLLDQPMNNTTYHWDGEKYVFIR